MSKLSLNEFVCCISNACMTAAEVTIPVTSDRCSKGRVPGWKQFLSPSGLNLYFSIFGLSATSRKLERSLIR